MLQPSKGLFLRLRGWRKSRVLTTSTQHGYTILEVMIFLAISSLMLVGAITVISGKQASTRFYQSMRNTESKIQDIINDVATGFYPQRGSLACRVSGGYPTIDQVSVLNPGGGCIYVGKVIQFAPQGSNFNRMNIYTVVGIRTAPGGLETTSLSAASPMPITTRGVTTSTQEVTEEFLFEGGAELIEIEPANRSLIGYFTTFGAYTATGDLISGSSATTANLLDANSPINTTEATAVTLIRRLGNNPYATANGGTIATTWPATGVKLCFEDPANSNRVARIILGSGGARLSTKLEFDLSCSDP